MLLYGKDLVSKLELTIINKADELKTRDIDPTICVIRMGENPDDIAYERMVLKRSQKLGICAKSVLINADATQEEVENTVLQANNDPKIHGILLLKPLPKHIDERKICAMLSPDKDLDGITPASAAMLVSGYGKGFYPCTVQACIELLKHYEIPLEGKNAVVLGRSNVIGKPVSLMLLKENATVTVCHSKTHKLCDILKNADIIIAAIGKAHFLGADSLRAGQTIIDVGINFDDNGKMVGDVDTQAAEAIGCSITPVPGGVGGVTTTLLFKHLITAAENA